MMRGRSVFMSLQLCADQAIDAHLTTGVNDLSVSVANTDMRDLAKSRLPSPIFHYIDGAADDEVTYRRNTEAFESADLIPNVLAGVENIDMSVEVLVVT